MNVLEEILEIRSCIEILTNDIIVETLVLSLLQIIFLMSTTSNINKMTKIHNKENTLVFKIH